MKLKTIEISGYRQIQNATLNMDDNITVIAGANNSGKTSVVELFDCVFGASKGKLCRDDIPVIKCQEWSNAIYPHVSAAFFAKKSKEGIISDICKIIFPLEDGIESVTIPPVEVKIQVDYSKDEDDIRNFADYIMELDLNSTSFFFVYVCSINQDSFRKSIDNSFDKLTARFCKLNGTDDENVIEIIKEMLICIYTEALEETAFFADSNYQKRVKMDIPVFKSLFNFYSIMAGRTLDDNNSDRTHILSKNMIDIASGKDGWKDLISTLPDEIMRPIEDAKIKDKVHAASIATLSDTIDSISKTNGGHTGNIVIDMTVTEDAIQSLLKGITCAKYQTDGCLLRESSQGLGYSNLIYIHLQLEKFKQIIDPFIVNFFVIEEPEAHMHPQMQKVFSQYLFNLYKEQNNLQGFITTHSHEVVSAANIKQLRVLRQIEPFKCQLFDLHEFYLSIEGERELIDLYDWFYAINFPDILFADKVIMYEGDTERMLIKSLLSLGQFQKLKGQYLSFVQVGGAYAYNYKPLIEFLGIKTVVITDLDYEKEANTNEEILNSNITNATIKSFAQLELKNTNPTVVQLYEWKRSQHPNPIVIGGLFCLAFQGEKDGYSRTLEEAMLAKHYGINSYEKKIKKQWKLLRENDNLKYTIPQKGEVFDLREIVLHTSNSKTDFMYSVILNKLAETMLPEYIKEALLWLME
jgi:predicted ATP-dependent endonuclease of OLD family